jgi:hypothetical protein
MSEHSGYLALSENKSIHQGKTVLFWDDKNPKFPYIVLGHVPFVVSSQRQIHTKLFGTIKFEDEVMGVSTKPWSNDRLVYFVLGEKSKPKPP